MKIVNFKRVRVGNTFYLDQDINKKCIKISGKLAIGKNGGMFEPGLSYKVFIKGSTFLDATRIK